MVQDVGWAVEDSRAWLISRRRRRDRSRVSIRCFRVVHSDSFMGAGNHYQHASAEESTKTSLAREPAPAPADCEPRLVPVPPEGHFTDGFAGVGGLLGLGVRLT